MDNQKNFSVIIVEDEFPARKLLEKFVNAHAQLTLKLTVNNGQDALEALESQAFDLLLLDIDLPVLTGIEVLDRLKSAPYVIFTTANETYAVKAFDIGAVDYLLKPFTQDRFNTAVNRYITARSESTPTDANENIQRLKDGIKYQKSSLSDEDAEAFKSRILDYMETEKPYRDMDVSLQEIAEAIDIPHHHFSQVINQKLNKNFYEFLNYYRVEEAKEALLNTSNTNKNILEISFDVGFKSKSTFNMVFKKICGITPSQYRKKNK